MSKDNKKWHEKIPPHGILCKKKDGAVRLITYVLSDVGYYNDKCKGIHVDDLTPITHHEWWQFAHWQDMKDAPLLETVLLLRNGVVCIDKLYNEEKRAVFEKWLSLPAMDSMQFN